MKRTSEPISLLGIIAVAFGLGVAGAYVFDLHSHVCDGCGSRWRHLGAFNGGDASAHACDACGRLQWWKDPAPPQALRGGHV